MKNTENYLKDAKGNPSSTRLFSYMLLKFFIWINIGILLVGALLIFLMKEDLDSSILLGSGLMWVVFDALLGIMIFAPKQMAKVQEIKELIEVIKHTPE